MQNYNKSQKLKWLTDWKASGLSTKKFAEGKPFSPSSLNYWNRKYKPNSDASSFIHVIPGLPKMTPYAKLTYPSGVTLEIYSPVASDYFEGLLT
jgi:hypothetical protein